MNETQNWWLISGTFLAAFVLTLLPMPEWASWMRPAWIVMVLIYWVTHSSRINVGIAWIIGLFLDVLNGTILGEHALALTIVAYLAIRIDSRFRMYPLLQQGICLFILVLLYQFLIFCTQGFIGELPKNWLFWTTSLTSMILWPWVFILIRDCRRRVWLPTRYQR